MLRTGLLCMLVVVGTTPVSSQSLSPKFAAPAGATESGDSLSGQHIDLSAFEARRIGAFWRAQGESAGLPATGDRWAPSPTIPGLSFGMAESNGASRTTKARHFAIVRLDNVTLFGGNIGGAVDGRSAHLVLTWHTGQ